MDDTSMNRYEKQLYTVFKTFDVDNEEALDRSAVHKLCDALQLEDRGATLVNTLFERRSDRITFAQFRNGLLAVLGGAGGDPARVAAPAAPEPPPQPDPPPHHSDDDSSGREVAPKFVFGSKKYGRRSRPPRPGTANDEPPSPRSSSASRLDTDDKKARQRMRCRRSASAMESREDNIDLEGRQDHTTDTFEHDRRIDRDEALALCRGLNMDGIDRRLIARIFDESGSTNTTVGEFFDRLNASLTTTMEETTREARAPTSITDGCTEPADDDATCGLPSELVLEAWERAGVQQPRRLLAELGFGTVTLRPPELERALDDELRALDEPAGEPQDARLLLMLAALALSRLRLETARRRADLATAERDKLRVDVAEANRHARLLAQEVDESHARIEAELKASLRRAETRHAETMRHAGAENAAERERAAAERARLEAEITRRTEAEARLRSEVSRLRERCDELDARATAAEQRCAEAERDRARLGAELRDALERGAAARDCREPAELAERLHELRRDNQQLRDRNDELCAALEAHARRAAAARAPDAARGGDLSTELDSLLTHERSEECDSSPVSIDQKFLGYTEAVTKLREIFESVKNIPGVEQTESAACATCAPAAAALSRLRRRVADLGDALVGADPPPAPAPAPAPDALRQQLLDAEQRHEDEKQKLAALVKDLETSLEQMKAEYDKCEEYWSNKLDEERDLYGEEQRLGDERLAELVAKIAEYERQFAAAPALPTIDERHSLEAQFTDLEEEFARYRRDKEAELSARAADVARLQERLGALERRRAPPAPPAPLAPPAPPPEVRELRARTARAEAAARRLHARLAAADLLVKDLYVENCQLAHRRPL